MAFLNFLRKGDTLKNREDTKHQRRQSLRDRERTEANESAQPLPKISALAKKTGTREAYGIIRAPIISEKSSKLIGQNVYAFLVHPRANKNQVKHAVFSLFGVEVERVRVVHIPPKQVRRGRKIGWKSGYKKALVTVESGQKIDLG